jgi:hypothetical protein
MLCHEISYVTKLGHFIDWQQVDWSSILKHYLGLLERRALFAQIGLFWLWVGSFTECDRTDMLSVPGDSLRCTACLKVMAILYD